MAWESRPLGDVCRVIGGGTPSKDRVDFYQGTIPWATVRDMRADLITETECHITKEAVQSSATNVIPAGNVVIATRVGLGKVCLLNQATAINQDLRGIIPIDSKRLSVRFLFHWLKSVAHLIVAEGTGATVQGVKLPFIKSLRIPLPPLAEQQRIVAKLDVAFAAIDVAKANAERNLQNARALFESHLDAVFSQRGEGWVEHGFSEICEITSALVDPRENAHQDLPHVGGANIVSKTGQLVDLKTAAEEKLISGKFLFDSSMVLYSKIRPYLMKVARPDFEGLCSADIYPLSPKSAKLDRDFLFYMLLSPEFTSFSISGSERAGMPKVNRDHLFSYRTTIPPVTVQKKLACQLDLIAAQSHELEVLARQRLGLLESLWSSVLDAAFSGDLTATPKIHVGPLFLSFPAVLPNINTTRLHAGILALAYEAHEKAGRLDLLTHVKSEKIGHMFEALVGVSLGRKPVKDPQGPDDFNHLTKVEFHAKNANLFDTVKPKNGPYRIVKKAGFEKLLRETKAALGEHLEATEKLLEWMLPLDWHRAEVVATVYAGWNNLLIDGKDPTDEEIIYESRENWHPDKLKIDRSEFVKTLDWLKRKGLVPQGKGLRVNKKGEQN